MKILMAQMNPIVGDISGNIDKLEKILYKHKTKSVDLAIFPELYICGYPPRDLLEKPWFLRKIDLALNQIKKISEEFPKTGILVGTPLPTSKETGRSLYNSAIIINNGKELFRQHKTLLPTYDVFDEARYFDSAENINIFKFKDEVLGISICEDAWNGSDLWPKRYYPIDPQQQLAKMGASILINISSSPYYIGKEHIRYHLFRNHARKYQIPFIFINQIGGNDELIFDGKSMVFNKKGDISIIFPGFKEHVQLIDLKIEEKIIKYTPQNNIESIYQALVLGIKDYTRKCNFSKVIIGLSGGIDSTVVCCLATHAIGNENVLGVTMPSPYSSKGSVEDSKKLAENLNIEFKKISISDIYSRYNNCLKDELDIGNDICVAQENIQARIRGNILMALSNKYGYLVLSAGNKSEFAVGYCTLYGDMSGGLAVISDVPKTIVYQLAEYINKKFNVIPKVIIDKQPSAELRPDQYDANSLPPYEILDKILYLYIDKGLSIDNIVEHNLDPEIVKWVIQAVDKNEYKRRQAPPGLKVTQKAFGIGRRMPIAAKYQ